MTVKHRTSVQRVSAALKLTGMAAALSFIMMMVLAGCPVEPDPEPASRGELTGSVSITGFAKVGGTLTANTGSLDGSGTVSYEWKRGSSSEAVNDVISGASGNTYTPVQEDLGKYLTVTVTCAGYTGSRTSPATAQVLGADAVEPTVTGVTVSSETADVEKGGTLQFTATVEGTGLDNYPAYKAVTWPITTADVKAGTSIDQNGKLTVAEDEAQTSLEIKAVSAVDPSKEDTAEVTVIDAPVPIDGLAAYLGTLAAKDAGNPNTVKLMPVDISTNSVMEAINTAVSEKEKFVTLDLSACSAAGNTISSNLQDPSPNDMNVIQYNSYIVGVILPGGLTAIGEGAFSGCSRLESVVIPDRVTSIGNSAFGGCTSLARVNIKDGVESIGERAFSGCSSLESVTIPGSVESIGEYAFWNCTSLASVVISEGVTSIGSNAFSECTSLASVTIPGSVESIGVMAFYGCSSLASVVISEGVTSIGSSAFYGCSSLASVDISEGVTSIGSSAFSGCTSLASVTIPGSVESIMNYAFSGCTSLASVTFAAESAITNFGYSYSFPGDLRAKYLATGGGAGTYTTTRQSDDGFTATWTKR